MQSIRRCGACAASRCGALCPRNTPSRRGPTRAGPFAGLLRARLKRRRSAATLPSLARRRLSVWRGRRRMWAERPASGHLANMLGQRRAPQGPARRREPSQVHQVVRNGQEQISGVTCSSATPLCLCLRKVYATVCIVVSSGVSGCEEFSYRRSWNGPRRVSSSPGEVGQEGQEVSVHSPPSRIPMTC